MVNSCLDLEIKALQGIILLCQTMCGSYEYLRSDMKELRNQFILIYIYTVDVCLSVCMSVPNQTHLQFISKCLIPRQINYLGLWGQNDNVKNQILT